ncbi:helix-turn-helix transcriptional regulator [Streptomyces prunicolor]|uniref:helix-turn-helix transcriptional regulator n=1 Tax=Streptomyces prunicolor TaxID=67348 RepID=UPI00343DE8A7
MKPLQLALVADDPITHDGAVAYLRTCAPLHVLPPGRTGGAEAALVLASEVTGRTMSQLERLARESGNPDLPIVLVAGSITRHNLARAIGHGLVSFLPRTQTGLDAAVNAVFDARSGSAVIPQHMIRMLVEQIRATQQTTVPRPFDQPVADLSRREIDVLSLMAEGLSTNEIGTKLNYAERTIKNVLHAMMTRLNLRNRAHAVAYAIRAGAI